MKKKHSSKKYWVLGFILLLVLSILFTYYIYFYPKTSVKSMSSDIKINNLDLGKKFIPNDIKFSLKELSVKSQTKFSEEELTDLFIASFNEYPQIKDILKGLKITINSDKINMYLHFNYKGIPLEGKVTFTAYSTDGKGIFHYEEGNVGFFSIPKDVIFQSFEDTLFFQFDKSKGDIILSFPGLKQLQVTKISAHDKFIQIDFQGLLKLQ